MTTDITVRKETEAIFKEACNELSIPYEVVRELEESSVFRIKSVMESEPYYLGRLVGLKIGQQITLDNLK